MRAKGKLCLLVVLPTILFACQSQTGDSSSSSPASTGSDTPISSSSSGSETPTTDSSSSGTADSSSSSTTPEPSFDVELNRQAIYSLITSAKTQHNYTYGLLENEARASSILLTPNYIYDPASKTATVALQSYEGEGKKILFSVLEEEGSFTVTNALSHEGEAGETLPYRGTDELDYLSLLDVEGVTFTPETLINQSDYFYSEDRNIITIFANMFGLSNQISGIFRVIFQLVEDGLVKIYFAPNFADDTDVDLIDATMGYIGDVGATLYEPLETFTQSFTLPEERLSDTALTRVSGEQISFTSNLTLYLDGQVKQVLSDRTVNLDRSAGSLKIVDESQATPTTSFYSKNEDGKAIKTYIGPDNEVKSELLEEDFSTFAPDFYTVLDPQAFVKVDDNLYRYMGYSFDQLVRQFTGEEDGMGIVTEMYATTDASGELATVTALSREVLLEEVGTYQYSMTLNFQDGGEVTLPSAHPDQFDSYKIGQAFAALNADAGYTLKAYSTSSPDVTTTYTVTSDVILIDSTSYDTTPGSDHALLHTYTGYAVGEAGLAPFKVGDDMVATSSDTPLEGETIDSLMGFASFDAKAFHFTDDTDTQLVPYDDVQGFADVLIGGSNLPFMLDSSLTFQFNKETGLFDSYSYLCRGELSSEVVKITYGAELPASIDFSKVTIPFEVPTSWETGAPDVYAELMKSKFIPQEDVALIPYLYDSEINDGWEVGNSGLTEFQIINTTYVNDAGDPTRFLPKYKDLLVERGWVYNELKGKYTHSDTSLTIRVGNTVFSAITIFNY